MRHTECFGSTRVTCNCAVVFRENNNILGVFACGQGRSAFPVRYLIDPLAPAGDITVSSDGTFYEVYYLYHLEWRVAAKVPYFDNFKVALCNNAIVIFTALQYAGDLSYGKGVCLSVCLSVCPSHA